MESSGQACHVVVKNACIFSTKAGGRGVKKVAALFEKSHLAITHTTCSIVVSGSAPLIPDFLKMILIERVEQELIFLCAHFILVVPFLSHVVFCNKKQTFCKWPTNAGCSNRDL